MVAMEPLTENALAGLLEGDADLLLLASRDRELASDLLESVRWAYSTDCPGCGSADTYRVGGAKSAQRRKRACREPECRRQFNWKSLTPFAGSRFHAEQVLRAVYLLRVGHSEDEVALEVERALGLGPLQARQLAAKAGQVVGAPGAEGSSDAGEATADLDPDPVPAPAVAEPEAALAPSVPGARPWRRLAAIALPIAGATLAVLLATGSDPEPVLASDEDPPNVIHTSWKVDGLERSYTNEKLPGESHFEFAQRHREELANLRGTPNK